MRPDDLVLLDTQAGVEHFGRGLARGFGTCLVVSDDTHNALSVAIQSARLARQSGILNVILVMNRGKSGSPARLARFGTESGEPLEKHFNAVVELPFEPALEGLDPDVVRILDVKDSPYGVAVEALAARLRPKDCGCTARRKARDADHAHAHGHDHDHSHGSDHDHSHGSDHDHSHGPDHDHSHGPDHDHSHGPDHDHGQVHVHAHGHGQEHSHEHAHPRGGRS
jgi:CO dehydrogenase maturation factor